MRDWVSNMSELGGTESVKMWVCKEISEWVSEWVREWVVGWMSEWVSDWLTDRLRVTEWVRGGGRVGGWETLWVCEWANGSDLLVSRITKSLLPLIVFLLSPCTQAHLTRASPPLTMCNPFPHSIPVVAILVLPTLLTHLQTFATANRPSCK